MPWGFRVDNDGRRHAPRISKVSNEDIAYDYSPLNITKER